MGSTLVCVSFVCLNSITPTIDIYMPQFWKEKQKWWEWKGKPKLVSWKAISKSKAIHDVFLEFRVLKAYVKLWDQNPSLSWFPSIGRVWHRSMEMQQHKRRKMKMEKGKEIITDDSNTLYLCFCENMLDGSIACALHAIALSHVLGDPRPHLGSSTSFLAAGLHQVG